MFELVQSKGYAIERHQQATEDGYILGMFHMPPTITPNGHVVFLQHALLDSSFSFVNNGPGRSLGFILADAGYDVWLGNNRGNTYSLNHTSLSTGSKEFWNFTYAKMGRYDVPAQIELALAKTGAEKLIYIGHSEGTSQAFAGFSLLPALAKKVALFVALAPVTYVHHTTSPLLTLLAEHQVDQLVNIFGESFLPKGALNQLDSLWCTYFSSLCDLGIQAMTGKSDHLNVTRIPVYFSQTPAGTSTKNIVHWAQGVRQPVFGEFDYGKDGNLREYGQETAPQFNLSSFSVPTFLVTGTHDVLNNETDIDLLLKALPSEVQRGHIQIPGYAHMDMVWAEDAAELLYPQILSALKSFSVSSHASTFFV